MSYSRIDPAIVDIEAATTGNSHLTGPLVAAWARLAAARAEPIGTNAEAWVTSLRGAAGEALRAIRAHCSAAEAPDSWLRRSSSRWEAETGVAEHRKLLHEAERLDAMAHDARSSGLGLGLRLAEQSVLLEIALARYLNRLGAMLAARPLVSARAAGASV